MNKKVIEGMNEVFNVQRDVVKSLEAIITKHHGEVKSSDVDVYPCIVKVSIKFSLPQDADKIHCELLLSTARPGDFTLTIGRPINRQTMGRLNRMIDELGLEEMTLY